MTPESHFLFSFDDTANQAYDRWRDWKLSAYPLETQALITEVENPFELTVNEKESLYLSCLRTNMAIYTIKYRCDFADKNILANMGHSFGLHQLDSNLCADSDSITSLKHVVDGNKRGYIPYSNLKLSWHTDGYYNLPEEQIRGVILHCVRPAAVGGVNALLDHEMLYIHLRDTDPAYIKALIQPTVMTIPANIEDGVEIRPAQTGPVFSFDKKTQSLHMRYSARKRNIEWTDDAVTRKAVEEIDDFLSGDSPWIVHHRLEAGQGLICNNVLHNRTAFEDSPEQQRLIYRGRYFDRIEHTSLTDVANKMS